MLYVKYAIKKFEKGIYPLTSRPIQSSKGCLVNFAIKNTLLQVKRISTNMKFNFIIFSFVLSFKVLFEGMKKFIWIWKNTNAGFVAKVSYKRPTCKLTKEYILVKGRTNVSIVTKALFNLHARSNMSLLAKWNRENIQISILCNNVLSIFCKYSSQNINV